MPRAGLDRDRVVDVAASVADREGFGALTLAAVAAEAGVRAPSLYNHVDGLDGLRRELTLRALRELGEALQRATVGRSGADAVRALAAAFRAFAHEHPGLYAATVPTTEVADEQVQRAGADVVATVGACLRAYGLEGDEVVHAVRVLRSAIHGFVDLELAGGFALDVALEDSFARLVDTLVAGLGAPT